MQKVTETDKIISGKYYLVPCILVDEIGFEGFKKGQYLPVLLPFHNDTEIGLDSWHYHYDHRFINPKREIAKNVVVGRTIRANPTESNTFDRTIYWKKMKCLDPTNGLGRVPKPLRELESTKSLKMCNLVCPHKGVGLNGIEPINGAIECPAHGLKFCATTGNVIL